MADYSLCFKSATELVALMKTRELSAQDVMAAHLAQIEKTNGDVNAIVTLLPGRAMASARAADEALAHGEPAGILHGLPIAHKDLVDTAGIRTTHGSPIFADNVPTQDALFITRIRQAGAITIGKTNTPEFGAGSQTFNPVFGATRNPYDLSKTVGGSSGGAAAALAARMQPIADGSDMGGSLRNPAAFCNVVGFRPSPGRVARWPLINGWTTLAVSGPMARTVADTALLLAAMAGPDDRDPISLTEPGDRFLEPLKRDFKGTIVSWSRDFGGLPIDPAVTKAVEAQKHIFADLGCAVRDGEPDFTGSDDVFKKLRAWAFANGYHELLQTHRSQLKETVVWNAESGMALSALDIGRAQSKRTEIYLRVQAFMETHQFMIFPVTQVPPFSVETEYITAINGQKMETYIDWMKSCYFISNLGLPAASVPCGFTDEGLPIGIQIVGRKHDDFGVLQLAHAFEQATRFADSAPSLAV